MSATTPADLDKTKKKLVAELEAIRTENAELKRIDAERTRAGETFRENDPMFRAIFEQAAVGVAEVESQTGRYLRINKKFCNISGYCREDMLQKTFHDITHPEDHQQDLDNMRQLLAGEITSFSIEKRYIHEKGQVVWVNLTVFPLWRPSEAPSTHVAVVEDITERKAAEEKLQKANKLLRTILDNLRAIVFMRDTQGHYVFINPWYESLYNLKNEDIIGNTPYDFLPAETAERLLREDRRIIASGEPLTHEEMVPAGDVPLHFLTTKVPLFDDQGAPYAVCGIATDITRQKLMEEELRQSKGELTVRVLEATQRLRWSNINLRREILRRKRIEKNLRESEERFRGHFELGLVGMGISGPDHKWLEANEYLCDLLGYSRQELLAKSWTEITHPDDLPMNLVFWEVMVEGKTPGYQMEKRFICKDGGTIVANVSVRCVRDEEGTLKYNLALVEDITERKIAEERLRASEAMLKEAQSVAHVGHWEVDIATGRLLWSDEVCNIFGIKPEEFKSSQDAFFSFVHPDDKDSLWIAYGDHLQNRVPYSIDHRIIWPDGEVRVVHEQCQTHYDPEGVPVRSMGTVQDITERKLVEEKLRLSEQRLKRLSSKLITAQENERRRIGKELHDSLGQLLAFTKISIEACVQRFVKKITPDELKSLTRLVPHIQQTIGELRRIIMDLRPTILDDMGIIATIKWFCRETQEGHGGITLNSIIALYEHDVPEELKIVIFRIMQEAVNNAVKHGDPQNVTISLRRLGEEVVLTVEDDGKGFDLAKLPPPKNKGSGLGLISMKERSEFVGGAFEITSGTGGTKIQVKFPHAHTQ